MYDFLLTLQQKSPHGGPFDYRSCETDVLGWVCEAATGTPMPDLMSELVWSRIGAQSDATIGVDAGGHRDVRRRHHARLRDLVPLRLSCSSATAPRSPASGGLPGMDRRHPRRRLRLAGRVRGQPG